VIARLRESTLWKTLGDLHLLHWILSGLFAAIAGLEAWIHGKPPEIILAYFFGVAAAAGTALHYLQPYLSRAKVWLSTKDEAQRQQVGGIPIRPRSEPNIVFQTPQIGGIGLENNVWSHGGSPNAQRYVAWMVPIKNEMLPGKAVGRGEGIKAEVIVSTGGTVLCEWSPARWVGEIAKTVEIPVSETKELIIAVRDSAPGGFWEMDSRGIPLGTRVGELKIRLLREDNVGTTSLIAKKFYKWKRAPELFDFVIQPLE
jgi:hypothetical protein